MIGVITGTFSNVLYSYLNYPLTLGLIKHPVMGAGMPCDPSVWNKIKQPVEDLFGKFSAVGLAVGVLLIVGFLIVAILTVKSSKHGHGWLGAAGTVFALLLAIPIIFVIVTALGLSGCAQP